MYINPPFLWLSFSVYPHSLSIIPMLIIILTLLFSFFHIHSKEYLSRSNTTMNVTFHSIRIGIELMTVFSPWTFTVFLGEETKTFEKVIFGDIFYSQKSSGDWTWCPITWNDSLRTELDLSQTNETWSQCYFCQVPPQHYKHFHYKNKSNSKI